MTSKSLMLVSLAVLPTFSAEDTITLSFAIHGRQVWNFIALAILVSGAGVEQGKSLATGKRARGRSWWGAGCAGGAAAQPARAPLQPAPRTQSLSDQYPGRTYEPTGVVAVTFVVRVPVNERSAPNPGAKVQCIVIVCFWPYKRSVSLQSITVDGVVPVPWSSLTAIRLPAREGGSHLPGGMSPVHHRFYTHRWSQGWILLEFSPHQYIARRVVVQLCSTRRR